MYDARISRFCGLLCLLLALVFGVSVDAHASFPASSTNGCSSGTCTNYSFPDSGWQSSVQAAADAQVVYMGTR